MGGLPISAPRCTWKGQLRTPTEWRALNPHMHRFFLQFAFLSNANVQLDELHVLYLGVCMYFLGSVLWLLAYELNPTVAPERNIERVWGIVLAYYTANQVPCQYSSLTLNSFCNPRAHRTHYPILKGKGAEVKYLTEPLIAAWKEFRRPRNSHDSRVLGALQHVLAIQDIIGLWSDELLMPEEDVHTLRNEIDKFLADYTYLGLQADARHQCLFSAVPKLHYLWHLGNQAMWLSLRRSACWIDEDFVGIMKRLAARCTASAELHRVPMMMMTKYGYGDWFEELFCRLIE